LLMILHRHKEAIDQANLALELNPLELLVLGLYGVVVGYHGDHQSAREYFEKQSPLNRTMILLQAIW
jgi:hypothetical protein